MVFSPVNDHSCNDKGVHNNSVSVAPKHGQTFVILHSPLLILTNTQFFTRTTGLCIVMSYLVHEYNIKIIFGRPAVCLPGKQVSRGCSRHKTQYILQHLNTSGYICKDLVCALKLGIQHSCPRNPPL